MKLVLVCKSELIGINAGFCFGKRDCRMEKVVVATYTSRFISGTGAASTNVCHQSHACQLARLLRSDQDAHFTFLTTEMNSSSDKLPEPSWSHSFIRASAHSLVRSNPLPASATCNSSTDI